MFLCHIIPLTGTCEQIAFNNYLLKLQNETVDNKIKLRTQKLQSKIVCFLAFRYKKDCVLDQGEEVLETLMKSWPNGKEQLLSRGKTFMIQEPC